MDDAQLRTLALPLLGKWSLFILYELSEERQHFAALERAIPGISRKVLTQTLRELIRSGIVAKDGKSSTGHKVYYSLTALGQTLMPVLYDIKHWLKQHHEDMVTAQEIFDRGKRLDL